MKVIVVGSIEAGHIIRGKIRIGQEVVLRHMGKVEQGVIVRTKHYTKTKVRFDNVVVMLNKSTTRIKGPISKGLDTRLISLASQRI
ncbi:MAG: hypothetical protein JSS98_19845 [Bacteroidetes bacterium]|nr:hypothetical protein [Bacteroidota bacterium]